jgi:hypothetical protein
MSRSIKVVLALKALDTAGRAHHALLSGVKRVAVGAYLDLNGGLDRTSLEGIAACARNHASAVSWMYSGLHCNRQDPDSAL